MTEIRRIYDEIMADLRQKGFGGYVDSLNDYKNKGMASPIQKTQTIGTSPTINNQNESPAVSPILHGGASSLTNGVI